MRLIALISFAIFTVSGCNQIRNELGYPGGFIGAEANRILPAFSPYDRADRYLVALALLAPMAAETARDKATAQASAIAINDSLLTLSELMEATQLTCKLEESYAISQNCLQEAGASPLAFETLSYDIQRNLYALSKQIATNAELPLSYEKLAALDVIGLMRDLDNLTQGFVLARRSLAVYRDAVITIADAMKRKACEGENATGRRCAALDIPTQARRFYGSPDTAEGRPIGVAMTEIRSMMQSTEYGLELNPTHRYALLFHVQRACAQLLRTQNSGDGTAPSVECDSSDEWEKINTAVESSYRP